MMKKFGMFLVAAFVALTSVSCIESGDSDYATDAAYVTVAGTSPLTYYTDEGKTLVQVDSRVGTIEVSYGDRLLIYYSEAQTNESSYGGTYITLYGCITFNEAESEAVATPKEVEEYGTLPVNFYQEYSQYALVHATKQWLDVALVFYATSTKASAHEFTLVLDESNPTTADNHLNLQLCHATTTEEAAVKTLYADYYSFDMTPFFAHIAGTKGVKITMPGEDDEEITHTFAWPTTNAN